MNWLPPDCILEDKGTNMIKPTSHTPKLHIQISSLSISIMKSLFLFKKNPTDIERQLTLEYLVKTVI